MPVKIDEAEVQEIQRQCRALELRERELIKELQSVQERRFSLAYGFSSGLSRQSKKNSAAERWLAGQKEVP